MHHTGKIGYVTNRNLCPLVISNPLQIKVYCNYNFKPTPVLSALKFHLTYLKLEFTIKRVFSSYQRNIPALQSVSIKAYYCIEVVQVFDTE